MEKNQLFGIIIGVIIISGIGLGYYFGIYLPNQIPNNNNTDDDDNNNNNQTNETVILTGLPNGTAPNVNLILKNGSDIISNISLQTIVDMLRNGSLNLMESQTIISGNILNLAGFNPLQLFDRYGLNYAEKFDLTASDGFTRTLNYVKFYMGDSYYYKDAVGEFSMIAVAANKTWLNEFNSSYGDMRAFGSLLSSGERVSKIVNITVISEIMVNVSINGIGQIHLSRFNMTTIGLNFTSYNWGYNDNASGKGWGPTQVNGTTIASIADFINITTPYNVSFVSIDGWGTNWKYNDTQMEDGLTGKMINTPPVELSNEGKQTILNVIADGNEIGYQDGPFRTVLPGQTRDRYQKAVVEIRFYVI